MKRKDAELEKDAARYRARREKAFQGAIASARELITNAVVDEQAIREQWNKRYDTASDMIIGMQEADRWLEIKAQQWSQS